MKYLPFENITLHTQLPTEEVIGRLSENLERKKFDPNPDIKRKQYEGYVLRKTFHINSTEIREPVVMGKFEKDSTGTTINLRIVPSIFQAVVLIIVLVMQIVGHLFTLYFFTGISIYILIPLSILFTLLFAYLPLLLLFKYNIKRIKKNLTELFEAEIKSTS